MECHAAAPEAIHPPHAASRRTIGIGTDDGPATSRATEMPPDTSRVLGAREQVHARITTRCALISRRYANHLLPRPDSSVQSQSTRRQRRKDPAHANAQPEQLNPSADSPRQRLALSSVPICAICANSSLTGDWRLPTPDSTPPVVKPDPKRAEARRSAQSQATARNSAQNRSPAARSHRPFRARTGSMPSALRLSPITLSPCRTKLP
jgi:hypothetical protein